MVEAQRVTMVAFSRVQNEGLDEGRHRGLEGSSGYKRG